MVDVFALAISTDANVWHSPWNVIGFRPSLPSKHNDHVNLNPRTLTDRLRCA